MLIVDTSSMAIQAAARQLNPVHSMIAQQAVRDCGFVQLDHPAYSPDLAPSDYFLCRNLKSHLRGVHYADNKTRSN